MGDIEPMGFINGVGKIFLIAVILSLTFVAAKVIKIFLRRNEHKVKIDFIQYRFLTHLACGFIYFIGITLAIYVIPSLRAISFSLFAGSGVLALIIGFASQQAFSNIVGGIFIAIFKPFRIGDRIKLLSKEISGMVEDITLRHTILRTFENKRVIIPNSVISSDIVENADIIDEKVCRFFEIGISYGSNIDKAMAIIGDEAVKHPDFYDSRSGEDKNAGAPLVTIKVIGFGDSSVNLRAWIWAKDNPTAFRMVCDLNKSVKERFDKEGVEIPFPYRTIVIKKKG